MQDHLSNREHWLGQVRALLEGNQIESDGHRYTRPAPDVYEYQWLWDSCFHAITYRWFDLDMAFDELVSLVQHQVQDGPDAGMIPHMTYWTGDGSEMWDYPHRSIITQPPLIGVAAARLVDVSGDPAIFHTLYEPLGAYHDWLDRRRDPDHDNLVSLIHPWESGWDASPRWDLPMGLHHPTDEQSKSARHALVKQLQAMDCDADKLTQAGSFSVEAADFNAIRAADLEALASMARVLGYDAEASKWEARAKAVHSAVITKMYRHGSICDLNGPDEIPILIPSAARFVLMFGGCVTEATASGLAQELKTGGFATPFPVPTTPSDSPDFDPDHYWRGNVWLAVNWLIYSGLRRYGHRDLARHIASRSLDLVAGSGFHEYFNPLSGAGLGPAQQSWSGIVLDMLMAES